MTPEKLKSLPVGSLVRMTYTEDEAGPANDIGEIIRTGPMQVDIMWPEKTVYVGFTSSWIQFIEWLEEEA